MKKKHLSEIDYTEQKETLLREICNLKTRLEIAEKHESQLMDWFEEVVKAKTGAY